MRIAAAVRNFVASPKRTHHFRRPPSQLSVPLPLADQSAPSSDDARNISTPVSVHGAQKGKVSFFLSGQTYIAKIKIIIMLDISHERFPPSLELTQLTAFLVPTTSPVMTLFGVKLHLNKIKFP